MSDKGGSNTSFDQKDDNWDLLSGTTPIAESSRALFNQVKEILDQLVNKKEWIITLFGYAGFDIQAFRTLIRGKLDSVEDLIFLIILFLIRGNNVIRIKDSTNSRKVVDRLKRLETKLHIKSKAAGKTQAVTLSRIAISFPEVVATILSECPDIPGAIRIEDVRSVLSDPEFPSISRQSALACFLPKNHPESLKMLNVFFVCNLMISETINTNNQKWHNMTDQAKANTTKAFQMNAFNSTLFNESERIEWSLCLHIIVGNQSKYDYSGGWGKTAESRVSF